MFDSSGRRIGVATALTGMVILIAVGGLGCSGGDSTPDRSPAVANRLCKTARQEIAQARRRYGGAFTRGDTDPLARKMFDAVGKLQSQLGVLDVPKDKLEATVALKERVYESEQPILDLITVPPRKQIPADARKLESIESEAKDIASELGFEECARLSLSVPPLE